MDIYTSKETRSITRIPQRILILFCERRIVLPFKDASGQGSQRLFSFNNLVEIMIAMQMWRFKMNFRLIKNILDLWRDPEIFRYDAPGNGLGNKEPDILLLRNFDSDYTGMALAGRQDFVGSFFDAKWVDDCSWIIIHANDPWENWKRTMTAFSTMLIDVGTISEMLKR